MLIGGSQEEVSYVLEKTASWSTVKCEASFMIICKKSCDSKLSINIEDWGGWGVGGRYVFLKTKLKAWHVKRVIVKLFLLAGKHLINLLWLNDFLTDSLTLSYIHI